MGRDPRYSPYEDQEILRLFKQKMHPIEIAAHLGRSMPGVKKRMYVLGIRTRRYTQRAIQSITSMEAKWLLQSSLPERLAELAARNAALELRSTTQVLMGDPPPGYSALDRRRE